MRTRIAAPYALEQLEPFAETRSLVVEEVELEPPGTGEALVTTQLAHDLPRLICSGAHEPSPS
jgi:hypothetical protein